jgi:N-acetyl-alpha-D-muramate 1-phosphate uridylyltransferase
MPDPVETDAPKAAMIFAAGFGTRMGALTRDRPKPLIPVAGHKLLDRALALARVEVDHIVTNAHYHADQIAAHLTGSGVNLLIETPDILDTGGGLKAAIPTLANDPVFTLNPDVVWTGPNPLTVLRSQWRRQMQALLLLIPAERAVGRIGGGDFSMDADGRLSRGGDLIYCGAQITRTGQLSQIPDAVFSLNQLWDMQAADGTLFGTLHTGGWCDVGHPDAIPLAEQMLAHG